MKNLSIALYFAGLLIAIVSAAKFGEQMMTKDIVLNPVFIIGMVMSIGGLIWWRSQLKTDLANNDQDETGDSPQQLIDQLTNEVRELNAKMENYGREDWINHLKKIQDNFIIKFNDQRHRLLNTLSSEQGSDLMIKFSYGERMLNRAYSCSADGYHHEGLALAPAALKSFEECLAIIKK